MHVKYVKLDNSNSNSDFLDALLAKGIRNDYYNEKVFYNIGICVNPDEVDIFDFGKNTYMSMNPPSISMKRAEYNQKVSEYVERNTDKIRNYLKSGALVHYLYRRLWETIMLRREIMDTSSIVHDGDDITINLYVSLSEAMGCIFSLTTNQPDIRKQVNAMFTSVSAVKDILEDSLIRDEKMRRLNLSNVLNTLNFNEFSWTSQYDTNRVIALRKRTMTDVLFDVQYMETSLEELLTFTNEDFKSGIFGTFTTDRNNVLKLCELLNPNMCMNVTDICCKDNDVSVSVATYISAKSISYRTVQDIARKTYHQT